MKKAIFTLAIAALALTAGAQDKGGSDKSFKPSIGLEAGLSTGSRLNIGASLQGEFSAAENIGVTLNAGYLYTLKKDFIPSSSLIPVLGGVKYYFSEQFFGHAQAGMTFFKGGGSAFTYSPGLGYQVSENFDITAKYLGFSKGGGSYFGLRAAYSF